MPIETPLEYLARRTFPDYRELTGELSSDARPPDRIPLEGRQKLFDDWWERHAAMDPQELDVLVREERQRQASALKKLWDLKESQRFFNRPEAEADFDFWSKASYWKIDEAIALSLGKSPQIVKLKVVQVHSMPGTQGLPPSPLAVEYVKRWELAHRAVITKQLHDPVLPTFFLAWARRLELAVPAELTERIERQGLVIADWQDAYKKQKALAEDLQKLNAELAEARLRALAERDEAREALTIQAGKISPRQQEVAPRERDTLLKLVIGMAIGGYGYTPTAGRSDATPVIAADLDAHGIGLDMNTIRKWLKTAAAAVLPTKAGKA